MWLGLYQHFSYVHQPPGALAKMQPGSIVWVEPECLHVQQAPGE